MPNGPRELQPAELLKVSETLARFAHDADVPPTTVRTALNLPNQNFKAGLAPVDDWLATVKAVHAGMGRGLGFRADAVAALVQQVAERLPGNADLAQLSYSIGSAAVTRAIGQRALFLSYASSERANVDALYDALAATGADVAVFQDHRSIAPGADWLATIRDAAGSASLLVGWVTGNFLDRTFCAYEIGVAEARGARIIPVWVDGLDPKAAPAYLSGKQGRNSATPHDFAALADWLINAL